MAKIPGPQYTAEQAISVALALATRALDEVRALARQPGPPGEKGDRGEPGAPGLGFDNFVLEGRRLKLKNGTDEREVMLPIPLYRGVWKPDNDYDHYDWTTWGGSIWEAQENSKGNKPGLSKGWLLIVKRGRDGKDGDRGPQGAAGSAGKDGRDLTIGPDGIKLR